MSYIKTTGGDFAYLIKEEIYGVEGAVFTKEPLSLGDEAIMYAVSFKAIEDYNHWHYGHRIQGIDKAKFINHYLKKVGIKGKYEYFS
jgi:hypothetical protein